MAENSAGSPGWWEVLTAPGSAGSRQALEGQLGWATCPLSQTPKPWLLGQHHSLNSCAESHTSQNSIAPLWAHPQPQGRGQHCPGLVWWQWGGWARLDTKISTLFTGVFSGCNLSAACWRGSCLVTIIRQQGKEKNSSLVFLVTKSQTESVQPNGHLHEGLSGFLGNQRFSDLSCRLKKQTLREWLVLGFCGRHLTKKSLLDPTQISAGVAGAPAALPGEAELCCSNCRLFHQHSPGSTRLCQHIYIKRKLEQVPKMVLIYCRDAVPACLWVPSWNSDFFEVKLLFFMDTELFLNPAEAWNWLEGILIWVKQPAMTMERSPGSEMQASNGPGSVDVNI